MEINTSMSFASINMSALQPYMRRPQLVLTSWLWLALLGYLCLPEAKATSLFTAKQSAISPTKVAATNMASIEVTSTTLATQRVRLQPRPSKNSSSYYYYYDLLELVFRNTEAEYGKVILETIPSPLSQSRGLNSLNSGLIDITWAGTNLEREQHFTPIRIPLIGGLLGMRVPVIKKARLAEFRGISTAAQLKKLTACQGSQWPDSDILEANGYKVERIIMFDLMYSMLTHDRCDYFPRGLNEVFAELEGPDRQGLMAYEGILLRYSLPMYFFVSKDNRQLEKRLAQGLEAMVESGELHQFISHHSVTRSMFPLSRYHQSQIFDLINPILPASTPFERPELWIKL